MNIEVGGYLMDYKGHLITTIIALGMLFTSGIGMPEWLNPVVFIGSVLVFTLVLNPDIDIPMPLVKHRGATHDPLWILIIGFVVGILLYGIFVFSSHSELIPIIVPFCLGFICAWYYHLIIDLISSKLKVFTWVLIIVVVLAYGYIKVKDIIGI